MQLAGKLVGAIFIFEMNDGSVNFYLYFRMTIQGKLAERAFDFNSLPALLDLYTLWVLLPVFSLFDS